MSELAAWYVPSLLMSWALGWGAGYVQSVFRRFAESAAAG